MNVIVGLGLHLHEAEVVANFIMSDRQHTLNLALKVVLHHERFVVGAAVTFLW